MRIFSRYHKKDGRSWTTSSILDAMALVCEADRNGGVKNSWVVNANKGLYINFERSNYADTGEVRLVSCMYVQCGDEVRIVLRELRDMAYECFGRGTVPLSIRSDQRFEGSRLEKECLQVYRPFLRSMKDDNRAEAFIKKHVARGQGDHEE